MAWRVNRSTGRERPFRPRLGGCLLWILILIAIVLVLAVFLGGVRKGTRSAPAPQAWRAFAASSSPSRPIDFSRISTLRILPVTVIGNSSVTWT